MASRHTLYLKRIHTFIKQNNVKFALLSLSAEFDHGYCITNSSDELIIIVLDPKKEFIPTLIHECLHGIYQKYKEKKIQQLEKAVMKSVSQKQIMSLLKCFCDHAKLVKKPENVCELL